MSHIRYHAASGHIDLKFTAPDLESHSVYERDGYAIMEGDDAINSYVDGGIVKSRLAASLAQTVYNAKIGDAVTITGLPLEAWVKVNNDDPIKTTEGSITIQPMDDTANVEVVGEFKCPTFITVIWSDLAGLKERKKVTVDTMAEQARSKVVTNGSGQAMTYIRKAEAARAYLAGQTISAPQMQRIEDEAARLDITVQDAAEQIVGIADQWEAIDAQIDSIRLTTKANIDAALTGEEIDSIVAGIVWPV
jgi:hypothetical protein